MVFKGGDRVRLKDDDSDKTWIVCSVFREMNEALIMGFGENTTCHRLVNPAEIVLVDQNEDIKQAIREVLLSEEFLAAFAAAWQKTPLIHNSELNLIACKYTGEGFAETAMKNYKSPEIIASTIENGESK